jgi:hypothetical protein
MLKNALSNGHSSQVRGWLVIAGVKHELAQVGPDFCILREPVSTEHSFSDAPKAELTIEVDGDHLTVAVNLLVNQSSYPKTLLFRRVEAA